MIKYVYSILWIQILSYLFMFYTDIFMFSTDISSDPSEVNKHYQCRAVYGDCLSLGWRWRGGGANYSNWALPAIYLWIEWAGLWRCTRDPPYKHPLYILRYLEDWEEGSGQ